MRRVTRAQDVGIGLAVAWARGCGNDVSATKCEWEGCEQKGCRVCGLALRRHGTFHRSIGRGDIVEPQPLLDHRVAFGIALAQRGPFTLSRAGVWPADVEMRNAHGFSYALFGHIVASRTTPGFLEHLRPL